MRNILKWLDNNLLFILSGLLLAFIPLYPKLPLLDVLPGYIVRVRLEDVLVGIVFIIYIVYLLRRKVKIRENPLFIPMAAYLIVGILSMLSALLVTKTVPLETIHVAKMLLHFLRRVEYFSLFFILFSSVKSISQIKAYLYVLALTVVGVVIYGFGQKYLYWPAFSTMNREFAKGWTLYLTEHARVISTFGGHYDLAVFIMMSLIVLWALFFSIKKWLFRLILMIIIAGSFWTLILTASRTSFIAYLVGISVLFVLFSFKQGLGWAGRRYVAVTLLSILVMLSFGDLSERFTKLLKLDERIGGIKAVLLSPIVKPPERGGFFKEGDDLAQITSRSDQPLSREKPFDVYDDAPLKIPEATDSSIITTRERTYSETAFKYDLSTAIRLDALWPRAIAGFFKNPLLGSGYSTLTKTQVEEFTEAESTDNDYLRALGETGLLGFAAFFSILAVLFLSIFRNLRNITDPVLFALSVGLGGVIFALLVNALYIDVFESSKVAFSFWAFSGIVMAAVKYSRKNKTKKAKLKISNAAEFAKKIIFQIKRVVFNDKFYLGAILFLALILRLYKINTPLADWHSWRQADTSAVTRNFTRHGVNLLYPTYDDLSSVPSGMDNPRGLRFVEFPLYNLASVFVDKLFVGYNVEFSGRLTSIIFSLGTVLFLFGVVKKYLGRKTAFISAFVYSVLPYNVFYNRVILPEPFLVFLSTGMIYFMDRFLTVKNQLNSSHKPKTLVKTAIIFFIFILFGASTLLVKPVGGFLFIPVSYLWFRNFGISIKSSIGLLLVGASISLPFLWWRWWVSHYPEGIPAYTWLLNGDGIRFKGSFFYWIFADRLSRLILGYFGLPLLILGIINLKKEGRWLFYWWGISMLLYVFVFATGNVRHDYYQIITIPIISVFVSKGIEYLINFKDRGISKIKAYLVLAVSFIFMEMFGWYFVRDFYNINHPEIVKAGSAVERKTHSKSLVVAPYNGDTAFLYQTGRAGWPIVDGTIDQLIDKEAHYFVSVNFDQLTKSLIENAKQKDASKKKFKIIEETEEYVIIQLVPDNKLPR